MADSSGDAEEPMDIVVNVIDLNDNNPVFVKDVFLGEVPEASPKSTGGLNSAQVVLNEIDQTCRRTCFYDFVAGVFQMFLKTELVPISELSFSSL